jgi:hypothetical protein
MVPGEDLTEQLFWKDFDGRNACMISCGLSAPVPFIKALLDLGADGPYGKSLCETTNVHQNTPLHYVRTTTTRREDCARHTSYAI